MLRLLALLAGSACVFAADVPAPSTPKPSAIAAKAAPLGPADAAALVGARRVPSASRAAAEAEQALVALGYRPAEAAQAVALAEEETAGDTPPATEALVRAALRNLARSGER